MRAIDILRKFIKAEHTGNWELHLQAVYDNVATFHSIWTQSLCKVSIPASTAHG